MLITDDVGTVLPLVQPSVAVTTGDEWFDEDTDKLYVVTLANDAGQGSFPIAEPTTPTSGDQWFDETEDLLYTYTTDWDDGVEVVTETYVPNNVGVMWFDEDIDTLYAGIELSTLPVTLVVPTVTSGYTFAGWFDAAELGTQVLIIPSGLADANFTLFAQWDMINGYIALPITSAEDKVTKVNVLNISRADAVRTGLDI